MLGNNLKVRVIYANYQNKLHVILSPSTKSYFPIF